MTWESAFSAALPYDAFLSAFATDAQRERWGAVYERIALTDAQRELLGGFQRAMRILCVAATWCGDCVLQGPILQRIAEAAPGMDLRFLERDRHPDVRDALVLNAGQRIPMVVFLSEDFQEAGRYGDRTLAMYRKMAVERLGPACPTGIIPPGPDYLAEVVADWMREVQRVQLLLRLSARLRAVHED